MSDMIGGRRKVYNKFERRWIDKHKDLYMNASTPAERKAVSQGKIFPDLFNYWASIGEVFSQEEENRRGDVSQT
jgi:hypothetical protein